MILALVALVGGLGVLARAADEFVVGAARLSARSNLSPVLVGAVVIGFGTSLPEFLVSAIAAGQDDLALGVGNVVGSNTANLTLVLAVAALITPMAVPAALLRREAPLMAVSAGGFALVVQGGMTRPEGVVLLVGMVLALVMMIRSGAGGAAPEVAELMADRVDLRREVLRTVIGLVLTAASAQVLVWAAGRIADELDLSGGFIGFTAVAVGTSAPELVTAIAAARRREPELVLGNLLGSNVFNSLGVGGAIALIGPGAVGDDRLVTIGCGVMVGIVLGAWLFCHTGRRVVRSEAIALLAAYLAAIVVLSAG